MTDAGSDVIHPKPQNPAPHVVSAGHSEHNAHLVDIVFLLFFVAVMQLRGFPPAVIDWDESLYAVVGRELLEGRLPYVSVLEIKPLERNLIGMNQ